MGPDGKERFYFRRKGQKKIRLHGLPWSPPFMAEYDAASKGEVFKQPIAPKKTGDFKWLCEQYFSSGEFKALDDKLSKPKRRNTLLKICREPIAPGSTKLFGDVALPQWTKKAVRAIRDRFASTPGTANDMMKSMRTVFKYGIDSEDCDNNPARDVKYLRGSVDGFHSWSIGEVVEFENTHAVGTKERLAMGLLLLTGQRISDAMRLGPKNVEVRDGKKWLVFTQHKNRNRKPIHMEIPMRPELEELIEATPTGETFLTNSLGKPYTAHRCGDWFAEACIAAGVPGRSHGLRKAAAARLAELGATEKEIMSITGHTTSQEIRRYTEAADRRVLAESATAKHVKGK
jgi:integrase